VVGKNKLIFKLTKIFLVSVLLCTLVCLVTSCYGDGLIEVAGKVYEWVDSPQNASGIIDLTLVSSIRSQDIEVTINETVKSHFSSIEILPLSNANIKIGSEDGRLSEVSTNGTGGFIRYCPIHSVIDELQFKVEKPGYLPVTGKIKRTGSLSYLVVAVLVKEKE